MTYQFSTFFLIKIQVSTVSTNFPLILLKRPALLATLVQFIQLKIITNTKYSDYAVVLIPFNSIKTNIIFILIKRFFLLHKTIKRWLKMFMLLSFVSMSLSEYQINQNQPRLSLKCISFHFLFKTNNDSEMSRTSRSFYRASLLWHDSI